MPLKWVYTLKENKANVFDKYRSRVCVVSTAHQEGFEYGAVFAECAKFSTTLIVMQMGVILKAKRPRRPPRCC